ncbi:hypothetical protein DFH08DRAFT_815884 [Mycena albidolilacea]|uniref:Uncharacterized protein n=1 Tax=Mycena albidolilacea TaxID=1033008 RepID=A0AAD6ZLX7_9AGAR|nr:hypothetical protein DFH08DRAFT_815884 [Mycena albidolilacea]
MLSLSSSQVHPDLKGAFRIIENGGRKAKAWLKDKQVGSKFVLPALYQPASLIPLEIWKSASSTTNGNEQSHRNINRDGVVEPDDARSNNAWAMGALELHASQGIYSRDRTATHFRRLQRSLNRHGNLPSGWRASAARVNEVPLFTTTPLAPALHSHPLHQFSWLDKETQFVNVVPGVPMQVDMPSTSFQPSANGTAPDSFHSVHSQLHTRTSSSSAPPYENFSQDSLDKYLATYGLPTNSFDPTFNPHISLDETSYMHVPEPYDLPPHPENPRTPFAYFNSYYNGTGVDEDLLERMPLLLATSRDHSITGPHPCTSPLGLNPQLRQHKLAVLKPTEPTDIPMALRAPRSSPVFSTHGCIWHCARTRPSTVNQHHPSQLELATKLPKEPGVRVLRFHETLHALVPRPCSSPMLICLCERAPMATASVSVPRSMPAAALAVHGLFVFRLDTAGWLWRHTKTSGGRGPSVVERYLTAFGHSEITEFYQSTTHSRIRAV